MQVGQKEIFITFRVEKSDYFRRDGADIHTDAFISMAQAALGGSIRLQGIYEDLTVDIPAGTASHKRIRLNNKGLRKVNAYGYGDHYVHIHIKIPVKLSAKQRALLLAYAEQEDDTPGTISGITYTKGGKYLLIFNLFGTNWANVIVELLCWSMLDCVAGKVSRGDDEVAGHNKTEPNAAAATSSTDGSTEQSTGLLNRIKKAIFG